MSTPYFKIPLNLPHAATIAGRIERVLQRVSGDSDEAVAIAEQLCELLYPCQGLDDNPDPPVSSAICLRAAELGRLLVGAIERRHLQGDRLGQCVRNLFECLELGQEGAVLSLRAGESPNSLQRPT